MTKVASITSQGQLTIPIEIRKAFNIKGPTKAIVKKQADSIVVTPTPNIVDQLAGSLKTNKPYTPLKKIRSLAYEKLGEKY